MACKYSRQFQAYGHTESTGLGLYVEGYNYVKTIIVQWSGKCTSCIVDDIRGMVWVIVDYSKPSFVDESFITRMVQVVTSQLDKLLRLRGPIKDRLEVDDDSDTGLLGTFNPKETVCSGHHDRLWNEREEEYDDLVIYEELQLLRNKLKSQDQLWQGKYLEPEIKAIFAKEFQACDSEDGESEYSEYEGSDFDESEYKESSCEIPDIYTTRGLDPLGPTFHGLVVRQLLEYQAHQFKCY